MEMNKLREQEDILPLQSPLSPVVAVAINGKKRKTSKYVMKWALQNFILERKVVFKLIYVRAPITSVPTPLGYSIPVTQVREDVVAAYRREVEWQTVELLQPYKIMCVKNKVLVDIVVIESDDVANGLAKEIANCNINKLVIGASTPSGMFSRKTDVLSSKISGRIPTSCNVYVISKGKLASIRPADVEMKHDGTNFKDVNCDTSSTSGLSTCNFTASRRRASQSLPDILSPSLANSRTSSSENIHFRCESLEDLKDVPVDSFDMGDGMSRDSSTRSFRFESGFPAQMSNNVDAFSSNSSSSQVNNLSFEIERLRIELNNVRGMYMASQTENMDTSRQLNDLNAWRLEEEKRREKEKFEAAKAEAAEKMRSWSAEREALQRRKAEIIAAAQEKEEMENTHFHVEQYHIFSWEDIVSATSSFSDNLRLGKGAYGTVYKCRLHYTDMVVKVLHSKDSSLTSNQFHQELEKLSNIRHPHLLPLIGACPDHGCLIYDYMENGNLEQKLLQKRNTPPIPWFDRYRIAWEVASALFFLHNLKLRPIVHGNLKPANILLGDCLVSKIGDVRLPTMLQTHKTIGTLCYVDPEYQRTGVLSHKSDIYAFGIVILQLLTAKPAMAVTQVVEEAINGGYLMNVLDKDGGNWPLGETMELAMLGLSCAEMRMRDRPDLGDTVLPLLRRLKGVADRVRDVAQFTLPIHFTCPTRKLPR